MKPLSDHQPTFISKTKARNEQDEYLEKFAKCLNADRIKDGFKPLPLSFYAIKLAHLKVQDRHFLWNKCASSDSFGRTFWGSLKPRAPTVNLSGAKPQKP